MAKKKLLSKSLEDYLEAILALEKSQKVARVKDIAERLAVQMPSVTAALRTLRERGLIEYEPNSFITLTKSGLAAARSVQQRHRILLSFLKQVLLLNPETAQEQACSMEHAIDAETARRIERCTRFITGRIIGEQISAQEWESFLEEKESEIDSLDRRGKV